MKPLKEILPDLFYKAVIRNMKDQKRPMNLRGLDSIDLAFKWRGTPEGDEFWNDVDNQVLSVQKLGGSFDMPPHHSWTTCVDASSAPLSGHNGLETPNDGHKPQTTTMLHKYADKPVATPTLVNGQDVTDLSDREILNQIKARKKSVEEIVATGATGAYVDHIRAQEGLAIDALLKELNSRAPQVAAAPEA
jgi:hypothetical protein